VPALYRSGVAATRGTVRGVGYAPAAGEGGVSRFPVLIEVDDKRFFDRGHELYIQAGVRGQAVIIVEENLSLASLVWEKVVDFVDYDIYVEQPE
jgi:hypothetical protein